MSPAWFGFTRPWISSRCVPFIFSTIFAVAAASSIVNGSPQDQIQAFRTFQISATLRDRHGYADITPALRAKIFGLNALKIYPVADDVVKQHLPKDAVSGKRAEYRERPDPTFITHGPKTRREFLNLKAWGG